MVDISKISPDDGSTILNIKDSNAVHWADNTILGAKNFCKVGVKSDTVQGVVYTVRDDDSINVNASSAPSSASYFQLGTVRPPAGTYILKGGTAHVKLYAQKANGSSIVGNIAYVNTDKKTITIDYSNYTDIHFVLAVETTDTPSNEVVYPMLYLADDTDETYRQYSLTNTEITKRIEPDSFTYTYTGTNTKKVTFIFYKNDNVVIIKCTGGDQVDFPTSWETIADVIPTKFRPNENYFTGILTFGGNCISLWVHSNGDLSIAANTSSPIWVQGNASYCLL